jgi:Secretion system C-terminal sorting domain
MKHTISTVFAVLVLMYCANAQVVINEIIPPNMVELKNLGGAEAAAGGYWLCQFPNYNQLSVLGADCGNLTIPAGGILKVTTSSININAGDGELGLYTTNNFGSSDAIIDYVEWGSTGHMRSTVAVGAGTWSTGDFVPGWSDCMSLEYDGAGDGSVDWMTQDIPSSPCVENTLDGCTLVACEITDIGLADIACNDNSTPADPDDDIITFTLNPAGAATAATYNVAVSNGTVDPTSGTFGQTTQFTMNSGSAGDGDLTVSVIDTDDANCTANALLSDPGNCSEQCQLVSAGVDNIVCDANGTDFDPGDDRIVFDLSPTGTNLGVNYAVSASVGTVTPANGVYGGATTFSLDPGTAGNGNVTITIEDSDDPNCMIEVLVMDPDVCSSCDVDGGNITTTDNTTLCLSDMTPDLVDVGLTGSLGTNSQWIIANVGGVILDLPLAPPFDFSGAGAGICVVWHLSYDGPITGLFTGSNIDLLDGCLDLSNNIEIDRREPMGGTISTSDAVIVCAGDGVQDNVDVSVTGEAGTVMAWVITDTGGVILSLPAAPPFDFETAGVGVCDIWHLSHEPGLTGLSVGNNIANIAGCYDFSNMIRVTRFFPNGGFILTQDPTQVCADDGVADTIDVDVIGNTGPMNGWIITSEDSSILSLPAGPPFSFEGAGAGICKIWHMSFNGAVGGLVPGNHLDILTGCYDLSNPISVVRDTGQDCSPCVVDGGTIVTSDTTTVCVGDGNEDIIDVAVSENSGPLDNWIITDSMGTILSIPNGPPFDFETAGAGICFIWHISYDGNLTGLEVGNNVGNLIGCFGLSNFIVITRLALPTAGTITTSNTTTFCVDDVIDDLVNVTLTGATGSKDAWLITDTLGVILGLPVEPPFNFSGSGEGVCQIRHVSYEGSLSGLTIGKNISDIMGCHVLSNPIRVTRLAGDDCSLECDVDGGIISTTSDTIICVGEGIIDSVVIARIGDTGSTSTYIVTDDQGFILDTVPSGTTVFTFEGAGAGICHVYHMSYEIGLTGLESGMHIDSLNGCYDLSNSIMVIRMEGNDCTTATRKPDLANLIKIFPNPTGGRFNIDFGDLTVTRVEIINSSGQSQHVIRMPSRLESINIDLAPGLYLIVVHSDKGTAIKKLIRQ